MRSLLSVLIATFSLSCLGQELPRPHGVLPGDLTEIVSQVREKYGWPVVAVGTCAHKTVVADQEHGCTAVVTLGRPSPDGKTRQCRQVRLYAAPQGWMMEEGAIFPCF
jgi:hypothetical protein